MNRETTLWRSAELAVGRFDHPRGDHHWDPVEEMSYNYSVNLVERGGFSLQIGGRRWDPIPGDLFLTYPKLSYRCRHREGTPTDSCLTVSYFGSERDEQTRKLSQIRNRPAVVPATNRIAYLFRRMAMVSFLSDRDMATESQVYTLLEETLVPTTGGTPFPPKRFSWYAERVDAARSLLELQYAANHTIVSLARSVGISSFHFVRVFAEFVGMPPHRYLLRVRMSEASRQLRQGASVTEACFGAGFQNLSHFIRSFRRRYGVSPARYARHRF
jgi:AraC family transcriptional regulator